MSGLPRAGVPPTPPLDNDDLGGFIRDQRRSARLSMRQLSELAGVSNPYLSQIERGLRRPSAEVLHSIARGLGVAPEPFYERAGLMAAGDLEGMIRRTAALTPGQQQALIDLYRSFTNGAPGAGSSGPEEPTSRIRP